jgi:hypothetical protein
VTEWAIVLFGVCISAGLFYRVAMISFFFAFTWVQLMDVTNYLNHYYLISLLAALMATMPLGRAHSIDALLRKTQVTHHPFWCTALLRFQVAVVYFFAAIAKATGDWLFHAQPISIWLAARTGTPLIGSLLAHPLAPWIMSVSGFLFDGAIWMFLLMRRTRPFAYAALVVFHFLTMVLFPIGMFPVIMVVTALVFFSPDWPRRLLRRPSPPVPKASAPLRSAIVAALAAHCALQVLIPLRAFAYGGNVLWHEQGMRWSWRVMCREKNASVTYWVEDPAQQRTWAVNPRTYLTDRQLRELGGQPDLVLQLAHHIARDWRARTSHDVIVRADVAASLNGRRAEPLVDPTIDLARTNDGLRPAHWIMPSPAGGPPKMNAPPLFE